MYGSIKIFYSVKINKNLPKNNYLYNDKAFFDEAGLNIGDYPLRNYDPQIGRWWQADPYDQFPSPYDQFPSPYTGIGNNPINLVDPSGGLALFGLASKALDNVLSSALVGAFVGGAIGGVMGNEANKEGSVLWKYYQQQPNCNVNAALYDIRAYFQGRNEAGKMNNKSPDETNTRLIGNLRESLKQLAAKIEPKVYEYGFLKEG